MRLGRRVSPERVVFPCEAPPEIVVVANKPREGVRLARRHLLKEVAKCLAISSGASIFCRLCCLQQSRTPTVRLRGQRSPGKTSGGQVSSVH